GRTTEVAIDMKRVCGDKSGSAPTFVGAGSTSEFAHHDTADRIARPEGADYAKGAGVQIILILVEGDDRARRAGVGVFIQYHRRFLLQIRVTSQQLAGNQHVHVQV